MKMMSLMAEFGRPWKELEGKEFQIYQEESDSYHIAKWKRRGAQITETNKGLTMTYKMKYRDWGLNEKQLKILYECFVNRDYVNFMKFLMLFHHPEQEETWNKMVDLSIRKYVSRPTGLLI
jgi:hypothetical protein